MRKRLLSVLLALCMLLSLCPMAAFAAEGDDESALIEVTLTEEERALYDEMLSDALKAKLLGMDDVGTFSTDNNIAGKKLSENAKKFYDEIVKQLPTIAKSGGSTSFSVSGASVLSEADAGKLFDALCFDYPYEMYWRGLAYSYGSTFSIKVSDDYKGTDEYTVDASKAKTASDTIEAASGKAKTILSTAERLANDLEKLVYFKEEICQLVKYNTSAAENTSTPYGDPWQLIYVFDGNDSTDVVCEGYSKAFQYLCDLSLNTAQCYTVSGKMGSGNHMWNIVTLDGQTNYLVDVTNCDGLTITSTSTDTGTSYSTSCSSGYPYGLFLAGGTGSVAAGYDVTTAPVKLMINEGSFSLEKETKTISYTYDSNTVWGSNELTLSGKSYPVDFYNITETSLNVDTQYTWNPVLKQGFTFAAAAQTGAFALPEGMTVASNGTITYTPAETKDTTTDVTVAVKYGTNEYPYYYTLTLPKIEAAGTAKPTLEGTVTITGTAKFDQTLTADTTGITSTEPGTLTYKWSRGDEVISGATSNTYKLVEADIGKTIKVEVSAENCTGSLSATTSAAVEKADYSGTGATAATLNKTADSVTVTNVVSGQEYSITTGTTEPSTWITPEANAATLIFDNLTANTAYKVFTRVAATATTNASTSVSTDVTTDKSAGSITIADPGTITYDGAVVEAGTSGKDLTYTYTGDGTVTVKWYSDSNGTKGSELTGGAPKDAGTYWVGISAAAGTNSAAVDEVSKKFTIAPKTLTASMVADISNQPYTGSEIKPAVAVKDGNTTLAADADYTVTYTANTNVGTATVTVTGKDNYSGEVKKTFQITAVALTASMVTVDTTTTTTYTGSAIEPTVTVKNGSTTLTVDTDYTVAYKNNTNAGTATITITGKGAYTGTVTKNFTITAKALANDMVTVDTTTATTYTGSPITPAVTVTDSSKTLTLGVDYTVAYSGNTNVGTATVTVTGAGNYSGTASASFTISVAEYTGTKTVDATLKIADTATATVDLSALVPKDAGGTATYKVAGGEDTHPHANAAAANGTLTLTYKKGTDDSNASESTPETVTVTVGGMTNYQDFDITVTIKYTSKDVANITITLPTGLTYDGTAKEATATVGSEAYDGEVTITYQKAGGTATAEAPKDAGTYTVTASIPADAENVTGTATASFTIAKKAITIKAKNQTVAVGATAPSTITEDLYEVTGLVEGDTAPAPTGIVYSSTAAATTTGTITLTGPAVSTDSNYTITYQTGTLTVTAVAVESVTLNKNTLSLTVGNEETLTATVTPDNANDKDVIWNTSDASVATVDTNGKVTAVGAGTANITAAAGGKTATCAVTVTAAETSHTHEWATTWTTNDTHHWHNCTAADCPVTNNSEKDGYGAHVYDNDQDTTCNTCGYVRTVTPPVEEHTHTYATAWTSDASGHWHVCSGCTERGSFAAHTPGDWIVDTAATSTTEGSRHKECSVCGYHTETESIPATGGGGSSSGGGSGSGGGTSSGGGTTTETTTNPDGSTTTKTENKTTGTVTETTKNPDGSQVKVETKKDGTVTITETDAAGNKSETVEKPDGSSVTKVEQKDGTTATVNTDTEGKVEAEVTLPEQVVAAAQEGGSAIALPIPEVKAAASTETAPAITVKTGSGEPVKVLIPTTEPTPGTVAVIVREDGTEEIVKTSVSTGDGLAVSLPDGATVKIVDNSRTFADVPASNWAADAVSFSSARELFSGTSEDSFSPNEPMTRAMMVTVLARFDGADTSGGSTWYEQGVEWAVSKGISDGSNPGSNISREQLAVMLWRYAGSPAPTENLEGFHDAGSVSGYAQEAMRWAVENGIINGNGSGGLMPQGEATRAQVAQMLKNFISMQ